MHYKEWTNKIAFFIPTYAYSILGIIAILSYYFFHGWVRAVAIVVFIYALVEASKREGHREGYFDGYGEGHYRGIIKTLGLSEEEAHAFSDLIDEVDFHSKY